jgi:hypothetical protein
LIIPKKQAAGIFVQGCGATTPAACGCSDFVVASHPYLNVVDPPEKKQLE